MKNTKFIFVTGGVVSSLGKGIVASSVGRLLKQRGLKVFMQKFDPYINVDPGTMSPYQHGEVFVTDDGAETDLDLGHYERFIDESLTQESNITTGRVYQSVINKERKGEYLGATVQVIPHITNEIKSKLIKAQEVSNADVIITEIGGTVGDIESTPFLEAIRQARRDFGYENTLYIHTTLVPFLHAAGEIKTKPTQHSVKELRGIGIQPDIIVLRSEVELTQEQKNKISIFCDVRPEAVIESVDCKYLYEIVNKLHDQHIDDVILDHFKIEAKEADLTEWNEFINRVKNLEGSVKIALVGKYIALQDAYISVHEALKAAGYANKINVEIKSVQAEDINDSNAASYLEDCDGILVPGGFGNRGCDGKMAAIKYARLNKIPFLGICLGMQLTCIEYAKDEFGLTDANSSEINPETTHPIIDYLPDQYKGINLGGTLRLGSYECTLVPNTLAHKLYGADLIKERHRHRYEFNNKFEYILNDKDLIASGRNPQTGLVEIVELKNHPYFIACQFHPEFKSRPYKAHPLFKGLIDNAIIYKKNK